MTQVVLTSVSIIFCPAKNLNLKSWIVRRSDRRRSLHTKQCYGEIDVVLWAEVLLRTRATKSATRVRIRLRNK